MIHPEVPPPDFADLSLNLETVYLAAAKCQKEGVRPEILDRPFLAMTMAILAVDARREAEQLRREVDRLRAGDFTADELQSLCHNLDRNTFCTLEQFDAGCVEYQKKLFGKATPRAQ